MPAAAFKEWAGVCRALGDGRQPVILRKGGIAEEGGTFRPDHPRFWLYPTFFHEREQAELKVATPGEPPTPGIVRLTHVAEVAAGRFARTLAEVETLDDLHVWTADAVRQRFHYRAPGLYVLAVRVFRCEPVELPERPEYAGCKTWVEFGDDVPDVNPVAAMSEDEFARVVSRVERIGT